MTTISKSEVLKRAWYLFKNQDVKTNEMFSECLRQSWAISKTNPFNFNAFYKQYYKGLLNYTMLKLGDLMSAEEVVNDSFMKVKDSIHTFDSSKGVLSSWLYAIANHAIIDYRRKNSKHDSNISISNADDEGHEYMQVADTCSAIDDQIADNEESNIIRSIIRNNLTDTQRKMAELRFIAQYSYDEIAAEMGLSMDNVKVTLHRAKKILQKEVIKARLYPAKV